MNVLYITNYADLYGANRSMLDMVMRLRDKYDIKPLVLISGNAGALGKELDRCKISFISHDFRITNIYRGTSMFALRKITRRIMRYKEYHEILTLLRQGEYPIDIIHTNSSIIEIGDYLSIKLHKPHVWHIREFAEDYYNLYSIFSDLEMRCKYRRASIIAISDAIRDYLEKRYSVVRINRIYNDVKIPEPYSKSYVKDGHMRFVIVGAVQPNKGQFDVIKACEILKKKGIRNFNLYIVGGVDNQTLNMFKDYVNEHDLVDIVKFTGYRKDVHSLLKDMDVGIMASTKEAFGRATVEYLAHYMTVIGTKTGGTLEIIDGIGKLYEPGDIETLAEHMEYCVNHPDYIKNSGLVCRKRAETFNKGKCAEEVYKIYRDLMNQNN